MLIGVIQKGHFLRRQVAPVVLVLVTAGYRALAIGLMLHMRVGGERSFKLLMRHECVKLRTCGCRADRAHSS
jgi:hypothetical protein